MTAHDFKLRRGTFQTERRRVQRHVVQSVLLCGLVLIILYALIVIATGIFIVYTQFFAPDLIANLNVPKSPQYLMREKRMDERLLKDPVARLLQADELKNGNLQTFAPYEDYDQGQSDEEKQIQDAASAIENLENSRLPLEFGLNRWILKRKLLSIPDNDGQIKRRKKRSLDRSLDCDETQNSELTLIVKIYFMLKKIEFLDKSF